MNAHIKVEIVCPHCRKLFTPRVKNQKYCNFECTQKVAMNNWLKRKRLAKRLAMANKDLFA